VRVALFVTCIGDTLFPEAGRAVVEVLERLGHDVVFPEPQTCCGQMHANSGYREEAERLARRLAAVLEPYELAVSPSSSCVGYLREHVPELQGRLFELSELLVNRLGVEEVGASFPYRVAYHPTCHSLRIARVGDAPLRLLRAVNGLELVDLPNASECCGFGGTFSVKFAELSGAMARTKIDAILATGATTVVSLDPSCLMQIQGALSRAGSNLRTMHLAEVLASR